MERKAIETMDTTQNRNQACCSRKNDTMRKVDVSLAHHRNFVLWEEGLGSTVKIWHDNGIADQARNDLKDY